MRLTMAEVLNRLVAERLAAPESIQRARDALRAEARDARPWFVTAAAGFGAWLATLLLLSFFGIAIVDGAAGGLIVGAACIAGAIKLRKADGAEFARQLALALSLAGQSLVISSVGRATESLAAGAVAGLALCVALLPRFPDRVHRFLSGAIAVGCVATLLYSTHLPRSGDLMVLALLGGIAWIWRWGDGPRDAARDEMLEPVGYALVIALFAALSVGLAMRWAVEMGEPFGREIRTAHFGGLTSLGVTVAMVLLQLAIYGELDERGPSVRREIVAASVVFTLLLAAVTWSTPGILAALGILLLGFDRRRPVLVGLAVLFVLGFGAFYYYSLRMTLLDKSLVLLASGGLLIFGHFFLTSRMGKDS